MYVFRVFFFISKYFIKNKVNVKMYKMLFIVYYNDF